MAKEEFERDLQDYLHARKRARFNIKESLQGFLKKITPKRSPETVEMHEEVEVYHEKVEKPVKKESILTKIFKKEPHQEEVLRTKMQADDAVSDMKEISKIALGMIKQLPDEQLREFKESPDFEKLKNILKKHELIK